VNNSLRSIPKKGWIEAEVDVLKRLQGGSRRGLHAPLDALLPAILDRAFKGEL
jgi:hypothetical protein